MPTLRSQTASLSQKEKTGPTPADVIEPVVASTLAVSPFPLGPATPTQDHEFARAAVTPIIRRSRRLNVEVASSAIFSSSAVPRRKSEAKKKAEASIGKQVERKDSPVVPCTVLSQVNSSIVSHHNASSDRTVSLGGVSSVGGNMLINEGERTCERENESCAASALNAATHDHDTKMQLEVAQVPVRLDSDPMEGILPVTLDSNHVEDNPTTLVHSENHQESQRIDDSMSESDAEPLQKLQRRVGAQDVGRGRAEVSRSRFLQIARRRAFHFAHFDADGNEAPAGAPPSRARSRRIREPQQGDGHSPQPQLGLEQVDWPGPFSTARQLVNNRAMAVAARQNTGTHGKKVSPVDWHPTRVPGDPAFSRRRCPSLQDLCVDVLSNNAESVVSLEGVPDSVRFRISAAFCEKRKMTSRTLSLFFQGEPSEIHSLDCTQVSEEDLAEMMKQMCPTRLEKLHLGHCGRALSERCLLTSIASPATMTLLKSIALRGAYRLSDQGLESLLQVSPQLVHLDLSNCSFLTNASVRSLVRCINETLESLVLDGCSNLYGTVLVHDVAQLKKLQKLSISEVNGVTDEAVSELCVQLGANLKELVLARCISLTDSAVAAIGACCPSLQVLNLAYLPVLTDVAIAHITDNLRNLQDLNVRRCKFSDEAIAAFVTASGASLLRLSLNSVQQVACKTILALTRHSHTCLEYLDLSFCRLVDDDCLGLLADSCLQLKELRLYGCTQVTQKFLTGHSNANLDVVGFTYSVRV